MIELSEAPRVPTWPVRPEAQVSWRCTIARCEAGVLDVVRQRCPFGGTFVRAGRIRGGEDD